MKRLIDAIKKFPVTAIIFVAFAAFPVIDIVDAVAQNFRIPNGAMIDNHIGVQGSVPTVTGGTMVNGSTDHAGQVTATGTGNVVVTFATAFNIAPFCSVTDATSPEGVSAVATTSTLTMAGQKASDKLTWICVATVAN